MNDAYEAARAHVAREKGKGFVRMMRTGGGGESSVLL
jgi:hypothetical protein